MNVYAFFGADGAPKRVAPSEDIADLAAIANKRFLDALTNREVVAGVATMMQSEIIPMDNCKEKVRKRLLGLGVLVPPLPFFLCINTLFPGRNFALM